MAAPIQFTSSTPRFALPLLFAGQAQKEFFVNEAHILVDALLHPAVEGVADAPPATVAEGECWLVSETPTGDWAESSHSLAIFSANTWSMVEPILGMRVFDKSLNQLRYFNGSWTAPIEPTAPQAGSVVDAEARQTIVELIEVLRQSGSLPQSTP